MHHDFRGLRDESNPMLLRLSDAIQKRIGQQFDAAL